MRDETLVCGMGDVSMRPFVRRTASASPPSGGNGGASGSRNGDDDEEEENMREEEGVNTDARARHSIAQMSAEYRFLLRVVQLKSITEVPGAVRSWWKEAEAKPRFIAMLMLPLLAAVASGVLCAALVIISLAAQFIVVPTVLALAVAGWSVALFLGCVSLILGSACMLVGSVAACALVVLGTPALILQLSNKGKRKELMSVVKSGLLSFRRSFRAALEKCNREMDINLNQARFLNDYVSEE